MSTPHASPVNVCDGQADFVAQAETWLPGSPFPVLSGSAQRRYESLFPEGLPPVRVDERSGVVLSVGGGVSRAAARLLSVGTGRVHEHLSIDHVWERLGGHADEMVALVGLANDLDGLGDWPGRAHARLGVLVARNEEALSSLVYRSLTVEACSEEQVFIGSHPMFRSWVEADGVQLSQLGHLRNHRPKVLVLRGQGRECSFSVPDGMICGRNEPLVQVEVETGPGRRAMPCLHGEGCFRTDLTEEELLPAADVNAALVFTHSCSSIAVGTNAYPHRVSLALGLLEGTAVAVIGSMGVHVAQPSAQWELEQALEEQVPLGDVVRRINEGSHPLRGELVRFGLLGDPGLVLRWTDPEAVRRGPAGRRERRQYLDQTSVEELTHLNQVVVPRLERLRWVTLNTPDRELLEIREQIREITATAHMPGAASAVASLGDEVAELQYRMVEDLVEDIYVRGWQFGGSGLSGFEQVESHTTECPNCDEPTAVRLRLRHRFEPALQIHTLQCRRCGEVWWTTEPGERTIVLDGPVDVSAIRGEDVFINCTLSNRGPRVVRGGVGYAFRNRRYLGLPPGASGHCTLDSGEVLKMQYPVDLVNRHPQPDAHTTPVVAVVNGVYTASMVMLNLR